MFRRTRQPEVKTRSTPEAEIGYSVYCREQDCDKMRYVPFSAIKEVAVFSGMAAVSARVCQPEDCTREGCGEFYWQNTSSDAGVIAMIEDMAAEANIVHIQETDNIVPMEFWRK